MKLHGGIKRFSGQGNIRYHSNVILFYIVLIGVEQNNDDARKHYLSSNHTDAPKEILLAEARIEKLSKQKRSYEKKILRSQFLRRGAN